MFLNNFKNISKEVFYFTGALAAALTFEEYCFDFFLTSGLSMTPTIRENNVVLINKLVYKFRKPKKGEIVIFNSIVDSSFWMCKRIIYLEGDVFEVNGRTIKVPENCFWVEGDNKDNSFDSRMFGPVNKFLLLGKVEYSVFPGFESFK